MARTCSFFLISLVPLAILGCSKEEFQLEKHKKYPLRAWPDSAYLAMVDSEYKADTNKTVKGVTFLDQVETRPTEMVLSDLPPEVAAFFQKKGKDPAQNTKPDGNVTQGNGEAFAEAWLAKAQALRADPSNPSIARKVQVVAGDADWDTLLKRVFGKEVLSVPSFLRLQVVRELNGGQEKPLAGQTVLLPKP